jgi:drug/metabolite transporter (DMT)-like permease
VLCWSTTPVLLRILTDGIDAWTANGLRYPLAALMFWPVLIRAFRANRLTSGLLKRCLIPAALAFSGQILWALTPYYLSASAIGFYVRSSLVWALLAAMLLFPDERVLLRRWQFHSGLALIVAGFCTLSIAANPHLEITRQGIVLILFCGLFFGLYGVSVRLFLNNDSPYLAFGVVCQYVSAGTVTGMLLMGDTGRLWTLPLPGWGTLIASSLLGVGLGHIFLYSAVRRLGAALTSSVQSLSPFITAFIASLFLSERMTAREWMAGVAMAVGAGVLVQSQRFLDLDPRDSETRRATEHD